MTKKFSVFLVFSARGDPLVVRPFNHNTPLKKLLNEKERESNIAKFTNCIVKCLCANVLVTITYLKKKENLFNRHIHT